MKFCSVECLERGAVCDFCIWYNFNGDEHGAFTGDGYCWLDGRNRWPEDGYDCNVFVCKAWKPQ